MQDLPEPPGHHPADIAGAARGGAVVAKAKLYETGLEELEDLPPSERHALIRRLTPEQVQKEQLELAEDMTDLLLHNLGAKVPQDVRDNLELVQLCLSEVRAGLGLRPRTITILTPRPKRQRMTQVQTAEEAGDGAVSC
jgi:hypothetical protein